MKTHVLATLSLLVGTTLVAQSARLTVDNSSTLSGDDIYADLATAHAAARDGDTILIYGSNLPYGNLTVAKRLVILGPGYLLAENPNTPISGTAIMANLIIDGGANNSTNPGVNGGGAGTEVRGLSLTQYSGSGVQVSANDVVVSGNEINSISVSNNEVTSITVIQNYLISNFTYFGGHPGITNLTFRNNIVNFNFSLPLNSGGSISHNLFLGQNFNVASFNGPIQSNIATSTNATGFTFTSTGNQVRNNTAANGQFGSDNGNNTAAAADLFVGATGNSTDGQYQLKATATAAKGTAHDGTDRGPFGGARPYILSGVPDLPVILYLELPATTRPTIPLEVTVRAASGN